jgi:hypothetical protein
MPELEDLAADVEALLIRRRDVGSPAAAGMAAGNGLQSDSTDGGSSAVTALIVPIDVCYELVGLIRRSWRGFHGGDAVWREIDDFFARAVERAGLPS